MLAIDNNGMLLDMMKEMYKQNSVECDICQSMDELTDLMRTKETIEDLIAEKELQEQSVTVEGAAVAAEA